MSKFALLKGVTYKHDYVLAGELAPHTALFQHALTTGHLPPVWLV
jgi:hypothetical protein